MGENQGGSSKRKLLFMLIGMLIVIGAVIGCAAQKEEVAKETPQPPTATQTQTGDRQNNSHSMMGLNCNQCHVGSESPKKVSTEQCLSCHKSRQEVALKTKSLEPNPHGPHHYDTADCTTCHSVHAKSQMMCSQCHEFKWINELGDEWTKL